MPLLLNDHEALRHLSANAVVYACAATSPGLSLLLGNGPVNVALHTPGDSIHLNIGRCDIWQADPGQSCRMGAIAAVRIDFSFGTITAASSVRLVSDPVAASVTVIATHATGVVSAVVRVLRGCDVILVQVDDGRVVPAAVNVVIDNWHEGDVTTTLPGAVIETRHSNHSSAWSELNRKVKIDGSNLGLSDPILGRTWGLWVHAPGANAAGTGLSLPAARHHEVRIAARCESTDDTVALRDQGITLATALDFSDKIAAHNAWWRAFWLRSHIRLISTDGSGEYEERLWIQSIYTIACGSGGPLPLRFNGGGWLLDHDRRDWDWGYWFQNMRLIYWPLPAAGHPEFMREFFRMYLDNRTFVRAQTRNIFGMPGLSYKETQTFWGQDTGTDLHDPKGQHKLTHLYFSGNLEVCQLMEWYVLATGDESFLRDDLYPFLAEVMAFYVAYMQPGADGQRHLDPVNGLETWVGVIDDANNLAGLRYLLPRLIGWGERFAASSSDLAAWRDLLAGLPQLPVGRMTKTSIYMDHIHDIVHATKVEHDPQGHFLPFSAMGATPVRQHNMENVELYPIMPWGLIGVDSDAATKRTAELTWKHRTWQLINNGWGQDVPQVARLGWGDEAARISLEHASYTQRFPNGSFISPSGDHFNGLLVKNPYFDTAGVHACGLNEMLLQSYDGIIRIAPACSALYSASFRLHAFGGIQVEAAIEQGQPRLARLTAERAVRLRLRNTGRGPMRVGAINIPPAGLYETDLVAGAVVEATWEDGRAATVSADAGERPAVVWPQWKARPIQSCLTSGHWHDERKGHGQVGLPADGRYPASA